MNAKFHDGTPPPDDELRKILALFPASIREKLLEIMKFLELKYKSRTIARTHIQVEFMRWLEDNTVIFDSVEPSMTEDLRFATQIEVGYLNLLLSEGRQSFARCCCVDSPCACRAKSRDEWTVLALPAYRMLKILSDKGGEGASFESLYVASHQGDRFHYSDKHNLSELISSSLRGHLEDWGIAVANIRGFGYRLRDLE